MASVCVSGRKVSVTNKTKKWRNPFYALLIPTGAAFCITAFAYGFMAFQQVNAGRSAASAHEDHPLFTWLRSHGTTAILVELGILAVLTVGAISTDNWWTSDDATTAQDTDGER